MEKIISNKKVVSGIILGLYALVLLNVVFFGTNVLVNIFMVFVGGIAAVFGVSLVNENFVDEKFNKD